MRTGAASRCRPFLKVEERYGGIFPDLKACIKPVQKVVSRAWLVLYQVNHVQVHVFFDVFLSAFLNRDVIVNQGISQ